MPKEVQKPKTWKDLKVSSKIEKPRLSFYARLKIFFVYIKYSIVFALLVCIALGLYVLYKTETIDKYIQNDSQKIKNFLFEEDKNITGKWLWDFTQLRANTPLDAIDIFEIKQRIERLNQIDSVKIEKIYPDTLKVSIEEKDCIAKTYSNDKLLIMSSKGEFYEPICLSQELLSTLIELSDLKIETKGEKYLPFDKAPMLKELLFIATNADGVDFSSWQKINMKKANYLVEPLMEIHTIDDMKIIFSFGNYKEQLLKLKATLEFSKKNAVRFEQIDLSLKDRADVKLKE
ncbi:MAG: FtsQ-type POTRA domain-containing protein [Opitutales bacterium]